MQFNVKTKQDLQNLISDLNNKDYIGKLEAELDQEELVDMFNDEEHTGPDAVGIVKLKI